LKTVILDVDGVLSTGSMYYSGEGKIFKKFGPDDADALRILRKYCEICFVSADHRGEAISRKRVEEDMDFPFHLVSSLDRPSWVLSRYGDDVCYVGDGFYDHLVFQVVRYGIAPANAWPSALVNANYVCWRRGGCGAVAEACMFILRNFFMNEVSESERCLVQTFFDAREKVKEFEIHRTIT